jgi:hypothetical protein
MLGGSCRNWWWHSRIGSVACNIGVVLLVLRRTENPDGAWRRRSVDSRSNRMVRDGVRDHGKMPPSQLIEGSAYLWKSVV